MPFRCKTTDRQPYDSNGTTTTRRPRNNPRAPFACLPRPPSASRLHEPQAILKPASLRRLTARHGLGLNIFRNESTA